MGVYIRDCSAVHARARAIELEKMTSPSPARPNTPSSVKLSTGRIVKKYQRLRARNSPLNDRFLGRRFLELVDLLLDALKYS